MEKGSPGWSPSAEGGRETRRWASQGKSGGGLQDEVRRGEILLRVAGVICERFSPLTERIYKGEFVEILMFEGSPQNVLENFDLMRRSI